MTIVERALAFDCEGERLVGVVAETEAPGEVGVVILVGGPQYRVGSHRQFLLLARRLASEGIPVLRFDYRGMGDSTGVARGFEAVSDDIAAAVEAFRKACPAVRRIVLWGLCDAASAALIGCDTALDAGIAGLVLLNPWVRSDATMAKVQIKHYYSRRFMERAFWAKLARGGVDLPGAVRSMVQDIGVAYTARRGGDGASPIRFQDRMASGLAAFAGPVLILLSGRDLTAKEFIEHARADSRWRELLARNNVDCQDLAEADHTFSAAPWRREVEDRTLSWIRSALSAEA
jgi:exosortase A-associated hydrolase 1